MQSSMDWDMDAAMMPWAAGLSTPSSGDGAAARKPLVFLPSSQRDPLSEELHFYADKMSTQKREAGCYVILFGSGVEDTEGIYTLRTVDASPDGDLVNVDTVLAFEQEVDAMRFATLLEASLYHVPSVYATSWGDITDWCTENNTRCRLEPSGSLLMPPDANVAVTDWERALSLQRGMYSVLDEEPAVGAAATAAGAPLAPGFFIDGPDWVFDPELEEAADLSNIVDTKLADSSIAAIRADLERLLNC